MLHPRTLLTALAFCLVACDGAAPSTRGRPGSLEAWKRQRQQLDETGLGDAQRIESIEVRWLDGTTVALRDPEPNRYHLVLAPAS